MADLTTACPARPKGCDVCISQRSVRPDRPLTHGTALPVATLVSPLPPPATRSEVSERQDVSRLLLVKESMNEDQRSLNRRAPLCHLREKPEGGKFTFTLLFSIGCLQVVLLTDSCIVQELMSYSVIRPPGCGKMVPVYQIVSIHSSNLFPRLYTPLYMCPSHFRH